MYRRPALNLKRKAQQTYARPRPVFPPSFTGRENAVVENVDDEDENLDIQLEVEVPQGNVYERREFHETPRQQRPIPLPSSLHECIENGTLHLDRAARLILSKMQRQEFNEAVYYEFIRSDVVLRAKVTYGTLNRLVGSDTNFLWHIANRMTGEISRAVAAKSVRRIESTGGTSLSRASCIPREDVCVSLENCVEFWQIQANGPFKQLDLTNISKDWQPKRRNNAFQQLCSLYRFLFQRMTEPPEIIQHYSIRLNQTAGRDEALSNLPEEVETILKDFGEDMLGYGHDELNPWSNTNLNQSLFYRNFGDTEEERRRTLAEMRRQRADWRPQIFKGLQMALRDVRSYTYEAGKWIANDHQKRAGPSQD